MAAVELQDPSENIVFKEKSKQKIFEKNTSLFTEYCTVFAD